MSNSIIPHLLSDSPPPLVADDEEFEDEFGDFKGSEELSFDNENPSTPSSLKNSKDYFPDTYSDFHMSNGEKRYQIFDTSDTTTNILNSIPPDNYFSIWKQIEKNIPDSVDDDEDVQESKENIDIPESNKDIQKSNEEVENCEDMPAIVVDSINNSNVNSYSSTCNDYRKESEYVVSSENIQEAPRKTEKNLNYMEENKVPESVEVQSAESNSIDEISSENTFAEGDEFEPTEKKLKPTFHTHITDNYRDFTVKEHKIEESMKDRNKIDNSSIEVLNIEERSSMDECDAVHTDNSAFCSADSDITRNFMELGSVENSNVTTDGVHTAYSQQNEENQERDDDFGEFADFSSCTLKTNNVPTVNRFIDPTDKGDFLEFESYQTICVSKNDGNLSVTTEENTEIEQKEYSNDVDEFDDFACYSAKNQDINVEIPCIGDGSSDKVLKICETPEEALNESQNVLKNIFLMNECSTAEYSNCDYIMNNSVFEDLKDITETNALTYQWSKSVAQKNILKTLNIDIRNILYGATWNSGVPIFAANLCSKPLEPIKSELPIPTSSQKSIGSQELVASTTTQFDWSGSGLTHLQDYFSEFAIDCPTNMNSQELDIFHPTLPTFEDYHTLGYSLPHVDKDSHPNPDETSGAETKVLEPFYAEGVPTPPKLNNFKDELSLLGHLEIINKVEECEEDNDDFGDFASHTKIKENEIKWKNMLPLRESHISSNSRQENSEMDKISIYFKELTMGKSDAFVIDKLNKNSKISFNVDRLNLCGNEQFPEDLPSVLNDCREKSKICLESFTSQNNPMKIIVPSLETDRSNDCDISADNFSSFETQEREFVEEDKITIQCSTELQEEEFTDFQSSLPCSSKVSTKVVLLEPLKPAILQPKLIKGQAVKIEWPEPGLDEAEINRIVKGVLRKNSTNENVEKTNNVKATEQPILNNDQDDWSDFMSVKQPLKTRTSTPDLTLSVFNLGNIQSNKVSAPYVAPNGVVHSPSKTPTISFPVINRNFQNSTQQYSHQRPFITSQAFDALYSNTNNVVLLPDSSGRTGDKMNMGVQCAQKNVGLSFPQNEVMDHRIQQNPHSSINHSHAEDDDWGDFVSAPNTISQSNSSANFFQPSSYMKSNFGFISKSVSVPKLTSKNNVVNHERDNLQFLSAMPDLDFVSPKSRSTIK